jgi:hypothetical protein
MATTRRTPTARPMIPGSALAAHDGPCSAGHTGLWHAHLVMGRVRPGLGPALTISITNPPVAHRRYGVCG